MDESIPGDSGQAPEHNKTFEQMLAELEQTAAELERGELPLEESISKFKSGMENARACSKVLAEAELVVKKIVEEGGQLREENFEAPQQ